jgi:hypothetical protein
MKLSPDSTLYRKVAERRGILSKQLYVAFGENLSDFIEFHRKISFPIKPTYCLINIWRINIDRLFSKLFIIIWNPKIYINKQKSMNYLKSYLKILLPNNIKFFNFSNLFFN